MVVFHFLRIFKFLCYFLYSSFHGVHFLFPLSVIWLVSLISTKAISSLALPANPHTFTLKGPNISPHKLTERIP